jgi:hypothetical protein
MNNITFGQDSLSKFSFAIHYAPSYSFVQHKNQGNLNDDLFQTIVDDELQRFVNQASVQIHYRPKSYLELRAGIGYQQLGHKTKIYESQLTNDSLISTQFFVSHNFVSIPVSVNYIYKTFFVGIGADLNVHHSSREKQVSTIKDGESVSKTELNKIRPFNPLIRATIGYNVKISQRLLFSVAPTIAFAPSYLFNNYVQINRKYWVGGLDVGLVYGF